MYPQHRMGNSKITCPVFMRCSRCATEICQGVVVDRLNGVSGFRCECGNRICWNIEEGRTVNVRGGILFNKRETDPNLESFLNNQEEQQQQQQQEQLRRSLCDAPVDTERTAASIYGQGAKIWHGMYGASEKKLQITVPAMHLKAALECAGGRGIGFMKAHVPNFASGINWTGVLPAGSIATTSVAKPRRISSDKTSAIASAAAILQTGLKTSPRLASSTSRSNSSNSSSRKNTAPVKLPDPEEMFKDVLLAMSPSYFSALRSGTDSASHTSEPARELNTHTSVPARELNTGRQSHNSVPAREQEKTHHKGKEIAEEEEASQSLVPYGEESSSKEESSSEEE